MFDVRMRTLVAVSALVAAIFAAGWFASPASAGNQPPGDANCDGIVNSLDATLVLQYDAALVDDLPCLPWADASFDFVVDSLDAAIILQREAGLISHCQPGQTSGFAAALRAQESIMVPGQPFWLTFSVSNCDHQTSRRYGSGQIFDVVVINEEGEPVWNWAYDFGFVLAPMDRIYGDRQTVTYGVIWDQLDNDEMQVEPGTYTVEATDLGCTLPAMNQCNLTATTEIQILLPPVP
jgi:hypothetical protein